MFTNTSQPQYAAAGPATVYFFEWLQKQVLTPESQARAQALFNHAVAAASPLSRLQLTPQTPPFHAEGNTVAHHVQRCLAALRAIERGISLARIEEVVREKDFILEFQALEEGIKKNAAFLAAYALCHDLGKVDSVVFEAAPGSKGAAEGFSIGLGKVATEPEKIRYDKLRRAHEVSGSPKSFYDEYGVVVHYFEHARRGAADEFSSTRDAVMQFLNVPLSHAKVLTELIRAHMEGIKAFSKGPDAAKYKALAAVAERAGVNVFVFLDLLPAVVFLDAVLGSLLYVKGRFSADFELILNLFRSEREAMPERHVAREEAVRRGRKQAVREVLKATNIDADTVFELLKTPYGPVRGEVMAKIHDLIRDPARNVDFGEHTAELLQRAKAANLLLSERHLSIDHL